MKFSVLLILLIGLQGPLHAAPLATGSAKTETAGPTRAELGKLAERADKELRGNILPFWLKYARNTKQGGFYGLVDSELNVSPNEPRGALLTSRILWTFSAAYRVYHDPQYLEMARWAYRDLMDNFRDEKLGGLYWSISPEGKPLDERKQIYGQVFGIYALAEYYRATGDQPALDEAIAIYQLMEKHARDTEHGGYFDVLDRNWARSTAIRNLLGPAPKSQNSHIHILEAYTNLLRAWPDAGMRESHRALVDLTLKRIIDPRTHHLILFFKDDWTPTSEKVSYGHDIELSWLLVEAAKVQNDPVLIAQVRPVSLAIAQATLAEGVDPDGGVVIEGNAHGITNPGKDWWSQAEGAVGFINAYELAGDPQYLTAVQRTWDLIEAKFVDRSHGDWIEVMTRDGRSLPGAKVSTWKCPYHNGRSCLELIERAHRLTNAEADR